MLYPLKFRPQLKCKIWGGNKIGHFYRHESDGLCNVGESWDISGLEGSESVVINGFLADNTLSDLVEVYMGDLVGEHVYEEYGNEFPLLVKIIDAAQNLSVQVHPNDELAYERHGKRGKSEAWYVMNVERGACLASGFSKYVSKEEYEERVKDGTIEDVLNQMQVNVGDVISVPAGCVHAIGRGCMVLEIQQPSDITYRIYDYGRKDEKGKLRELHTELAVDAIDFDNWRQEVVHIEPHCGSVLNAVDNDKFVMNLMSLDSPKEYNIATLDSFVILTCVDGHVKCFFNEDYLTLVFGESLLIPAEMTDMVLVPTGNVKLMETYMK